MLYVFMLRLFVSIKIVCMVLQKFEYKSEVLLLFYMYLHVFTFVLLGHLRTNLLLIEIIRL